MGAGAHRSAHLTWPYVSLYRFGYQEPYSELEKTARCDGSKQKAAPSSTDARHHWRLPPASLMLPEELRQRCCAIPAPHTSVTLLCAIPAPAVRTATHELMCMSKCVCYRKRARDASVCVCAC